MAATQSEPTPEPTAAKGPQSTEYVVLARQTEDDSGDLAKHWVEIGRRKGVNDRAAIKAVIGDQEGTFVAVPVRSWRPRTRKIETKPQDLWS